MRTVVVTRIGRDFGVALLRDGKPLVAAKLTYDELTEIKRQVQELLLQELTAAVTGALIQ